MQPTVVHTYRDIQVVTYLGVSVSTDDHSDGVFGVVDTLLYSSHFLYSSDAMFEHMFRYVSKSTCFLHMLSSGHNIFDHVNILCLIEFISLTLKYLLHFHNL